MVWLVLSVSLAGSAPEVVTVGLMRDAKICAVAGAGMAQILVAATPGVTVQWACVAHGVAV